MQKDIKIAPLLPKLRDAGNSSAHHPTKPAKLSWSFSKLKEYEKMDETTLMALHIDLHEVWLRLFYLQDFFLPKSNQHRSDRKLEYLNKIINDAKKKGAHRDAIILTAEAELAKFYLDQELDAESGIYDFNWEEFSPENQDKLVTLLKLFKQAVAAGSTYAHDTLARDVPCPCSEKISYINMSERTIEQEYAPEIFRLAMEKIAANKLDEAIELLKKIDEEGYCHSLKIEDRNINIGSWNLPCVYVQELNLDICDMWHNQSDSPVGILCQHYNRIVEAVQAYRNRYFLHSESKFEDFDYYFPIKFDSRGLEVNLVSIKKMIVENKFQQLNREDSFTANYYRATAFGAAEVISFMQSENFTDFHEQFITLMAQDLASLNPNIANQVNKIFLALQTKWSSDAINKTLLHRISARAANFAFEKMEPKENQKAIEFILRIESPNYLSARENFNVGLIIFTLLPEMGNILEAFYLMLNHFLVAAKSGCKDAIKFLQRVYAEVMEESSLSIASVAAKDDLAIPQGINNKMILGYLDELFTDRKLPLDAKEIENKIKAYLTNLKKNYYLPQNDAYTPLVCEVYPFESIEFFEDQLGWNCFDLAVGLAEFLGIAEEDPRKRAIAARAALVQYALDNANNPEYRRLLAPEIRHAAANAAADAVTHLNYLRQHHTESLPFGLPGGVLPVVMRTDELCDLVNSYERAHEDARTAVAECNDALGRRVGQRLPLGDLKNFFNDQGNQKQYAYAYAIFKRLYARFVPYENAFQAYCENQNTYVQYVKEYYGKNQWVAFQRRVREEDSTSMVDIIARRLNAKIIIYQKDHDNYEEIYRTSNEGNRRINVLYNGHNHFTLLQENRTYYFWVSVDSAIGLFRAHPEADNETKSELSKTIKKSLPIIKRFL